MGANGDNFKRLFKSDSRRIQRNYIDHQTMIQPYDKIYREIDIFDKSPAQLSNKEDLCISASSSLPDKKKAMSLEL